jgi:hypothetical protein
MLIVVRSAFGDIVPTLFLGDDENVIISPSWRRAAATSQDASSSSQ